MIDNLDSSSSILRLLVSQALKKWSIDEILKLLKEDDVIVRTSAARELHVRGGEKVFENIKLLVCSKRAFVREIAAFTLGQLGTPSFPYKNESIPILSDLLDDLDSEVRATSVAALGHLCYAGMPIKVEVKLLSMAKDTNEDVRACVAYSLGNSSGNDSVRSTLQDLESEKNETVSSYAKLGLELIDDRKIKGSE